MVLPFVAESVAARQPTNGRCTVLSPQDLNLLREALAYWIRHAVGLELTVHADPAICEPQVEATEQDIVALIEKLAPDNVRYIVVDCETNHAINTRLFRKVPKLQPTSGRWQVRTVVG
jgi:hypothetical protein